MRLALALTRLYSERFRSIFAALRSSLAGTAPSSRASASICISDASACGAQGGARGGDYTAVGYVAVGYAAVDDMAAVDAAV